MALQGTAELQRAPGSGLEGGSGLPWPLCLAPWKLGRAAAVAAAQVKTLAPGPCPRPHGARRWSRERTQVCPTLGVLLAPVSPGGAWAAPSHQSQPALAEPPDALSPPHAPSRLSPSSGALRGQRPLGARFKGSIYGDFPTSLQPSLPCSQVVPETHCSSRAARGGDETRGASAEPLASAPGAARSLWYRDALGPQGCRPLSPPEPALPSPAKQPTLMGGVLGSPHSSRWP